MTAVPMSYEMQTRRLRIARTIAIELKKLRLRAGFTQTRLARLLSVNTNTVTAIEGNGSDLSRCSTVAIAYAWVKTCGGSLEDCEAMVLRALRTAEPKQPLSERKVG